VRAARRGFHARNLIAKTPKIKANPSGGGVAFGRCVRANKEKGGPKTAP